MNNKVRLGEGLGIKLAVVVYVGEGFSLDYISGGDQSEGA